MVKELKNGIFRRNWQDILVIFLFLILPFVFFKDAFNLNSIILGMRDSEQVFLPYHYLKIDILKNLEFPFWNNYIFSGFPLFSSPSAGILYPVTLILGLVFPAAFSFNISVLLHYSLAGIFLYLFLREYKLKRIACFTAGLIFMFSGSMITHRDHITMLYTMIWFPLVLLFLEKYRSSKRMEFIFLSSIFYSFSFFAGNPQMFLYGSIVVLFYIIFYLFIYKGFQKYFLFSLTIFLFLFLLIAVQLIPSYILTKSSIRDVSSYAFFSDFSFDPRLLPVLIFPFLFGTGSQVIQGVPKYFGPWNSGEMLIYFGISTISLLILSFFRKNKHKFLWIFILCSSFILVFGRYNPLYKILYYIPLINKFRISTRHWFEFGLAFSILAGFGFDYFIDLGSKKVRKLIVGVIAFFSTVITGFFIFYLAVNSGLKDRILNFLFNDADKIKYFLQNLRITNYSIYIPLVITTIAIAIFITALFKKNKIIYILLAILIFLDLFSFGHFLNKNRDISYISSNLENSDILRFVEDEEIPFRVLPVSYEIPEYKLYANTNIYYGIEIIDGHDPMQLEDYGIMTGIRSDPGWGLDWKKLLRNNNIISMLNTKYIIVPVGEEQSNIKDDLRKSTYENRGVVLDQNDYENADFVNSRLLPDENEIMLSGERDKLKVYEVPIDIDNNKDYLVSLYISIDEDVNSAVHFDFYGSDYDRAEQEFYLDPDDIEKDYKKITYTVNSGTVPDEEDVYFRVFTYSGGECRVKDLEIYEVDIIEHDNYEIIHSDGNIMILENQNFIPRFYFVKFVQEVNDLEQSKEILWEEDIIWDEQRFDPHETALVEGKDFSEKEFKNIDPDVTLIDYRNNNILLETESKSKAFMVFSDNYYPGWESYIDGEETKIYRTNGILKGIIIPEGKHIIEFRYSPPYFKLVSSVSLSTFILLIGGIIFLAVRRKRLINK
jgi:hypothetical protein